MTHVRDITHTSTCRSRVRAVMERAGAKHS
jgi:hypothetical protein